MRTIEDPFVVATPSGVRIRTRLRPDSETEIALREIGEYLGIQYRKTLAERVRSGRMNAKDKSKRRTVTKRELTSLTSSRWAGAITRSAEDQYQLGMRGLVAEVRMLHQTTTAIQGRLGSKSKRPYRDFERRGKRRRLAQLTQRLAAAQARLSGGEPTIVAGGGRLWRIKNNLEAAGIGNDEWSGLWAARRMFFTADGETGKRFGNETITADPDSTAVRIKVPVALVERFGRYVSVPMSGFAHRGDEWSDRASKNKAVRYDITFNAEKGRWYIDASWGYPPAVEVPLTALRAGKVLGVDLNAGHLAAHILDASGNPVASPITVPLETSGLPATTRDARVREAISRLLDIAKTHDCKAIVIENLDFKDARATGRETMGRGKRGKTFRRTVSGLPTARFRDRLAAMAATAGVRIVAVDPAYTSKWGSQHWRTPLKTSDPQATGHHAASVAIGRRGLGHPIRRKRSRPAQRQRTLRGTPTPRQNGSTQPPTRSNLRKEPDRRSALSRTARQNQSSRRTTTPRPFGEARPGETDSPKRS